VAIAVAAAASVVDDGIQAILDVKEATEHALTQYFEGMPIKQQEFSAVPGAAARSCV
jgi:hypothetical protein